MKSIKLLLLLLFPLSLSAQSLKSDSLVTDFTELVRLLEETHPDPYTSFGGRYFFQEEVRRIKEQLKAEQHTARSFATMCSAFLSHIPDQHTYARLPQASNAKVGHTHVGLGVMPEGLFIKSIDKERQHLLGCQVISINQDTMDCLVDRMNRISASENKYGSYLNLAHVMARGNLARLFPQIGESIEMELRTPQDKIITVTLPVIYTNDQVEKAHIPHTLVTETDDNLSFGFTHPNSNTMYIRIKSIMAQENYWFLLENKMPGLDQQLGFYYHTFLKKQQPQDTEEAIKGVPSFLDSFTKALEEMKKHSTENLIIDLRGNTGGYTPITLPSLYMLFGDEYLNKDMGVQFSRRVSELWLKKMNMTLDAFNKSRERQYKLGDFTFTHPEQETTIEAKRKAFILSAMCSAATKEQMEKQQGQPLYKPRNIYVITDAGTFSAAFHYTFYLWKLGAKVIGVPSRQAPNTFMEGTWFNLPYTGMNCSISNSIQICLPYDDRRAKIFYPDIMPTVNDYIRHSFDANTEVLFLLDYINATP